MRLKQATRELEIPQGIDLSLEGSIVTVKGKKGELKRDYSSPSITFKKEGSTLMITSKNVGKQEKTQLGTIEAHIKNMIKGVQEGHVYVLKVCSGHFPMTVQISGNKFQVKNFFGEKVPRVLVIKEGVSVKQDGERIVVEGIQKELTSQTAADIEQLTRITNRDRRIFQDGIYIISKDGKEIA